MTVVMGNLEREDAQLLHEAALSAYLDGQCYAFAIALHRGLGWPLVGLIHEDTVRHAMVRRPKDGILFDVRGPLNPTEEELGRPFRISSPYRFSLIQEGDLRVIRLVHESMISRGRLIAERLWPNLPWLDSLHDRVRSFAEELEALSRKYNLWIRGPFLAAQPLLVKGEGDETGYAIYPCFDPTTWNIQRILG